MKILNQSQNLRKGIESRSQRWVVAVVLETFPSGAFTHGPGFCAREGSSRASTCIIWVQQWDFSIQFNASSARQTHLCMFQVDSRQTIPLMEGSIWQGGRAHFPRSCQGSPPSTLFRKPVLAFLGSFIRPRTACQQLCWHLWRQLSEDSGLSTAHSVFMKPTST